MEDLYIDDGVTVSDKDQLVEITLHDAERKDGVCYLTVEDVERLGKWLIVWWARKEGAGAGEGR